MGYGHSCALITNGTIKCWGDGNYGGNGDWVDASIATALSSNVSNLYANGRAFAAS